jgi:hypothetical protein
MRDGARRRVARDFVKALQHRRHSLQPTDAVWIGRRTCPRLCGLNWPFARGNAAAHVARQIANASTRDFRHLALIPRSRNFSI